MGNVGVDVLLGLGFHGLFDLAVAQKGEFIFFVECLHLIVFEMGLITPKRI